MNSPSDENEKRQREDFTSGEDESNMLEASTVKCFPAVKRSFRQKQCNWRWRWKYFTRALQPISEKEENTKDDTSKVDDNDSNPAIDGDNEKNIESFESRENENLESNNQHLVDCTYNSSNEINSNNGRESVKSKEDYSACIKLIEKFQEAVLDNAVRIIQAAFKRFRERRRFLKLKKAATVIQRSVRRWLQLRHSINEWPELQSAKPECERDIEMQKNCFIPDELEREVTFSYVESNDNEEERETMDESFDGQHDSLWTHKELAKDDNDLPGSTSERTEQFDNSFESLDVVSLSGSADNLSDTEVCVDQSGEISPSSDPDSLSLADSGIDMCSDTTQEALAIIEDCECSKIETTSPSLPTQ